MWNPENWIVPDYTALQYVGMALLWIMAYLLLIAVFTWFCTTYELRIELAVRCRGYDPSNATLLKRVVMEGVIIPTLVLIFFPFEVMILYGALTSD